MTYYRTYLFFVSGKSFDRHNREFWIRSFRRNRSRQNRRRKADVSLVSVQVKFCASKAKLARLLVSRIEHICLATSGTCDLDGNVSGFHFAWFTILRVRFLQRSPVFQDPKRESSDRAKEKRGFTQQGSTATKTIACVDARMSWL